MEKRMVSLKDIALRCGVSTASVSKALNGREDIGEETRLRICRVADEMGYLSNSAARALKTNRTYNLGVLFVDERRSGLTHEYFAEVLEGFKSAAESCGYDITFINHNVGGKPTSYLQHCHYRGLDGVVIACVDFSDPQVLELIASDIPVVTVDHVFNNRMAILSENVDGTAALVRYAYEKGHRRIAYIHGENTSVCEKRLAGFYRACEDLGLEVPDEYIRTGVFHDPDTSAAITRELLELPERPTCILYPDDISYVGGLGVLQDAGLRVPEDISAAGYDGIRLSRILGLTTWRQDSEAIGIAAARELLKLIERPKTAIPDRVLIPGRFQEGTSIGPAPAE